VVIEAVHLNNFVTGVNHCTTSGWPCRKALFTLALAMLAKIGGWFDAMTRGFYISGGRVWGISGGISGGRWFCWGRWMEEPEQKGAPHHN
jgi:hypothetical protein